MKYAFIAQDEYEELDGRNFDDGRKIKDPVTISITIEVERSRYQSVLNRYKVHVADKIQDLFKPSK